jgi:hypothetical protein
MSVINDHLGKILGFRPAAPRQSQRPWSEVSRVLFNDPTSPPRTWETDVAGYLSGRRYHVNSIRVILEHARECGTAECCSELQFDARDRAHVESLLPEAPAAAWDQYPETWSTTALDLVA